MLAQTPRNARLYPARRVLLEAAKDPANWRPASYRRALREALRTSDLPAAAQEFGFWLADRLDQAGRVEVAEILRLSPRSRSTIFRRLRILEDAGLVERHGTARQTGPGTWERTATIAIAARLSKPEPLVAVIPSPSPTVPPKARGWRPTDTEGVVYFVQAGRGGAIKIGWTADLTKRLAAFRTHNAAELSVLVTIPGTESLEWEIQERFAADRLRGEWFRPSEPLLDYIADLRKSQTADSLSESKGVYSEGSVRSSTSRRNAREPEPSGEERALADDHWGRMARSRTDLPGQRPGYSATTADPAERARLMLDRVPEPEPEVSPLVAAIIAEHGTIEGFY